MYKLNNMFNLVLKWRAERARTGTVSVGVIRMYVVGLCGSKCYEVDSSSASAYQFDGMQQVLFALSSCQVDSSSASTYQFDRVQQVQFALSSSSRYHVAYQSDRPD